MTFAALVVAAAGFVALEASGHTDTPVIPPGLIVIAGAAAVVALVRSPWAPVAGIVAGLFNLIAMFVVGADDRLGEVSPALAFIGSWVMVLGLVAATIAGALAIRPGRPGRGHTVR